MTDTQIKTVRLPRASLAPNGWNPNVMTEEEQEELKKEIQHLGRVPKPVVVRVNGDGYEIVDGEQTWQAAVGILEELECEVITADDFEAMRQTYKRNQHGKHDRVREGRMFKQMLAMRKKTSQRNLAEEIGISEGTIRNSLMYADVAEKIGTEEAASWAGESIFVNKMTVAQIRTADAMTAEMVKEWVEAGLPEDTLEKLRGKHWMGTESLVKAVGESGLWQFSRGDWDHRLQQVAKWHSFEQSYAGFNLGQLRQYTRFYFEGKWQVRDEEMMTSILEMVMDPESKPPSFKLTAEEFGQVIEEAGNESHGDFYRRVTAAVLLKTGSLPDKDRKDPREVLAENELLAAPEWTRLGEGCARLRLAIWKEDGEYFNSSERAVLEQAKRAAIAKVKASDRPAPKEKLMWGIMGEQWEMLARWRIRKEAGVLVLEKNGTTRTEGQLAMDIALAIRLYDGPDDERAKWLAKRLVALNKVELLVILSCIQKNDWLSYTVDWARKVTGHAQGKDASDAEECVSVTQSENEEQDEVSNG